MAEYRLDVRPILEEVGASVHVKDTLDIDELLVGDERFVMVEPPTFDLTVSNAGEALVSIGSISAPVRATCSRCLCDFETTITGDVEGMWLRPGDEMPGEEELSGTVDPDGGIDLEPALVAALVVEAPFAPIHAEDCAGLCPACGVDLNVERCSCADAPDAAHPFAALKDLLGDESSSEGGDKKG
jgi:uncharacterized protein